MGKKDHCSKAKLLPMKTIQYLCTCLFFSLISCSKKEEVGSLRIFGSNTEYNHFQEASNGQTFFLSKNAVHFLNKSKVSDLSLEKISSDSFEIENISGNKDTLLLQINEGFAVYFDKTKSIIKLKNFGFTICDKAVLIDSFLVVARGGNSCQMNAPNKLNLFLLNKKNNLINIGDFNGNNITQMIEFQKKIICLTSEGTIQIFKLENGNLIKKISEFREVGALDFRLIRDARKLLLKTKKGITQLKINVDFTLKKVNEITI